MAEDFGHVWLRQQNSPHLAKPETGAKIVFSCRLASGLVVSIISS